MLAKMSKGNYAGRQSQRWCPSQVLPFDEDNDGHLPQISATGKIKLAHATDSQEWPLVVDA